MSFKVKNTVFSNQSLSTQSLQFTPLSRNFIPNDRDTIIWDSTRKEWVTTQSLTVKPASDDNGVKMVNPPFDTTPTIKNIEAGDEIQITDNESYITINSTAISNVSNTITSGEKLVKPPSGPNDTTRVLKTLEAGKNISLTSDDLSITIASSIVANTLISPSYVKGNNGITGVIEWIIQNFEGSQYVKVRNFNDDNFTITTYGSVTFNITTLGVSTSVMNFEANIPGTISNATALYPTLGAYILLQQPVVNPPYNDSFIELNYVQYVSTVTNGNSRVKIGFKLVKGNFEEQIYVVTLNYSLRYESTT